MRVGSDPRRRTPRTDAVLADPRLEAAARRLGRARVKEAVVEVLGRVPCRRRATRTDVVDRVVAGAARDPRRRCARVVNATGVVVHTNLGRAPLSAAAVEAVVTAAGRTDVELDLATGRRGRAARRPGRAGRRRARRRGGARRQQRRRRARPGRLRAGAGPRGRRRPRRAGRDRRRLPDPRAAGVGRRAAARGRHDQPGAPRRLRGARRRPRRRSCSRCTRRTSGSRASPPSVAGRASSPTLGVPVVADIGSGLLAPASRGCPTSPTRRRPCAPAPRWSPPPATSCSAGRSAGCCSATPPSCERLRRYPLARALRVDKLTLAALEATLTGPVAPGRRRRSRGRRTTCCAARRAHRRGRSARAWPRRSRPQAAVGGGGAPGVALPSAAVALPAAARRRRCARGDAAGRRPRRRTAGCCSTCSPCRRALDADVVDAVRRRGSARSATDVHVVATAGHVDHGKSTLVRALTGRTPTGSRRSAGAACRSSSATAGPTSPAVGDVAFVDVPGHERFLSTTLAGRRAGAGGDARGRRRRPVDAAGGRAPRRPRRPRRPARRPGR